MSAANQLLLITGLPCTGKTTLADTIGSSLLITTYHTDYLISSGQKLRDIARLIDDLLPSLPRPLIVEGCAVISHLYYFSPPPKANLIYLSKPRILYTSPNQTNFAKALTYQFDRFRSHFPAYPVLEL